MKRHAPVSRRRESGFSLLETALSLGILGILLTSIVAFTVETSGFVGAQDSELSLWIEATRGVERTSTLLRESGNVRLDGADWPRVTNAGEGLEFRLPGDVDGDGTPFSADTGDLEWDPAVYSIAFDGSGDAAVRRDGTIVRHLARDVAGLSFATILEDPSLRPGEVRLAFTIRKDTAGEGPPLENTLSTTVLLRNSTP